MALHKNRVFVDWKDGKILTKTKDYHTGMFIVDIKADNMTRAIWLVENEVYPEKEKGSEGIIAIDASVRKVKKWPYSRFKPFWWDDDIVG